MPTVLALDVSLSMSRPVQGETNAEEYSRKNLAINGLSSLLDQFSKLEFTSLIVFSYLWEQLVPFTRDTDAIKSALNTVGDYSKTCLEPFLAGISGLIVEEFGGTTPVQVILVTDGSTGVGTGSLKNLIDMWTQSSEGDNSVKCPLPFAFRGKLLIACIANPSCAEMKKSIPLYERLIELNGDGELFIPEGPLSMASVQDMFTKIAEKYYTPYTGLLTCGHLKCNITLYPSPEIYKKESEFVSICKRVSDKLEICGFMDLQDIASPPTVSRHLVLPIASKQKQNNTDSAGEEDEGEDGKQPSFTVLLHGSLKVEGMVAVTRVA